MCAKNFAKIFTIWDKCWLFLNLYYEKGKTCQQHETKGLFWKNIWMIWDFESFAQKYLFFGKCSLVLRIFLRKCQFLENFRENMGKTETKLVVFATIYLFSRQCSRKQKVLGYFLRKVSRDRNEWQNQKLSEISQFSENLKLNFRFNLL